MCAVLLEDGGDCVLMPSFTEFAVIELGNVLKLFNDTTERLSGDLYPILGSVKPILH